MAGLTISTVARQAGLRPSTLRYYESIGLLPEPMRQSGKRVYEPTVVQRLAIIRTAQQAGFTLDEVRLMLNTILSERSDSGAWHTLIERKLSDLETLLRTVIEMRTLLEEMRQCDDTGLAECIYQTGQRHQNQGNSQSAIKVQESVPFQP